MEQREEQNPREIAVLGILLQKTQSGELRWSLNGNALEFGFQAAIGGWSVYLTSDAVRQRDQLIAYSNAPVLLYATKSSLKEATIFDSDALRDVFLAARRQYVELMQSAAPDFFDDVLGRA